MWRLISNSISTGAVLAIAFGGFAGAANASATIDLIWDANSTDSISDVVDSSTITLQVILTAGPNGSQGAAVGIDYGSVTNLSVLSFSSTPGGALPIQFGETYDTGSRIENVNSVALISSHAGIGLSQGQSHQLGTVTFHAGALGINTFEVSVDANELLNGVWDIDGTNVSAATTFNSAFIVNGGPVVGWGRDDFGEVAPPLPSTAFRAPRPRSRRAWLTAARSRRAQVTSSAGAAIISAR